MSFIPHDVGKYIWKDKITIFNPSIKDLEDILSNIEYLNIINDNDCDYINIPNTIQHLHLSIKKLNNYKQSNLPYGLKSLIITIPEMYKSFAKEEINETITLKTKLPFGCELIIDNDFI